MKLYTTVLSVFVLALLLSNNSFSQGQFSDWLIVKDAGVGTDTLWFGHSTAGTYCIDASLGEYEGPPFPPEGVFEIRVINHRGSGETCLGQGLYTQYQFWDTTSNSLKDSMRVKFQPGSDGWPMTFSWPANLGNHYNSAQMKISADGGTRTIDMLSASSETITEEDAVTVVNIFTIPRKDTVLGIVKQNDLIPGSFALNNSYPNPFNPATTVNFAVQKASFTEVAVYDMLGKKVRTLASENIAPGYYNVEWNGVNDNGSAVASGTYYIRMSARYDDAVAGSNTFTAVQKVLLMK